ncbi:MAG TPA: hypothetical protein VEX68_28225 [Bryobacteraceae bacterium]|nr:hypothetical protein [Bryobacteraceae bacterium]
MNKQLILKRSFAAALFAASMTAETTTPFIGAGAGQFVRLKVTAADVGGERRVGQIGFRDQHGKQVGPATRVDLAVGEVASLNLPTKAGEHANVRAILPTEGGRCGAAIEVLDGATGRTVARATPTSRFSINFTRTPLGLASGQTMRVAIGSVDNPDLRCESKYAGRRVLARSLGMPFFST